MQKRFTIGRIPILIQIIAVLAIIGFITFSANSRSNGSVSGVTATTSNGCSCHGNSSSNTTLSASSGSGSFIFDPSSSNSITVTVSNGSLSAAGVNIAVKTSETGSTDAGTLSAPMGSGLQVTSSELTHTTPKSLSGGSASFTFNWTAPSQHGTYYLRAVGNAVNSNNGSSGDAWNWLTPVQITVKGVTLTAPNGGNQFCLGTSTNITWNYTGLQNVKIELSSDGGSSFNTVITNSTPASTGSYLWMIPNDLNPGNSYKIRISDASNSTNNDVSDANFTIGGATQITTHPLSQNKCTGGSVTFTVNANGAGLGYQWRKNNNNIQNATQSSLQINNLTLASAGEYDCVITGQCGSPVTSNKATLTVDESPAITLQPQSQTVCRGANVSFTVNATGTEINYQWRKSGIDIANANTPTLQLTNVQESDNGSYTCLVNGKCQNPVVSSPAFLTVNLPAQITQEPENLTICEAAALNLSVIAVGQELNYEWRKNGNPIPNANQSVYSIQAVTPADSGNYTVIVRGSCLPADTSRPARVNIKPLPFITSHPASKTIVEGSSVTFSVAAVNSIIKYQWRKDGQAIPNAISQNLEIGNATIEDAGKYECVVTNDCGDRVSNQATLTVTPKGPGAILTLSTDLIDFGTILIGTSKDSLINAIVKNIGSENLTITAMIIFGKDVNSFELNPQTLPITLAENESANISIKFTPKISGIKNAILSFESNSSTNPELTLLGSGGIIEFASEGELDFGNVQVANNKIMAYSFKNIGDLNGTISFQITGTDNQEFKFEQATSEILVQPEEEKSINIIYEPSDAGASQAILTYEIKESGFKRDINLKGFGETSAVNEIPGLIELEAYPNPTNSNIIFKFISMNSNNFNINIFDSFGTKVYSGSKLDNEGNNYTFIWDGRDSAGNQCSSGVYSAVIHSGDKISVLNFILNK